MDPNSSIGIAIVERDDAVVVVVEGEVDLWAAPDFRTALARARASEAPSILVDLDRVSFMDSAGLHALFQFVQSEPGRDRLVLTASSAQVQRLLEVTGMRRYLSLAPSAGL